MLQTPFVTKLPWLPLWFNITPPVLSTVSLVGDKDWSGHGLIK
jgi:hypothetical protein